MKLDVEHGFAMSAKHNVCYALYLCQCAVSIVRDKIKIKITILHNVHVLLYLCVSMSIVVFLYDVVYLDY